MIGRYITNDGSCMMLPSKDGTLIKVPKKQRRLESFQKKENKMMHNYIDARIGKYIVFNTDQMNYPRQNEDNTFQGFWKMSFNGACSKFGI